MNHKAHGRPDWNKKAYELEAGASLNSLSYFWFPLKVGLNVPISSRIGIFGYGGATYIDEDEARGQYAEYEGVHALYGMDFRYFQNETIPVCLDVGFSKELYYPYAGLQSRGFTELGIKVWVSRRIRMGRRLEMIPGENRSEREIGLRQEALFLLDTLPDNTRLRLTLSQ